MYNHLGYSYLALTDVDNTLNAFGDFLNGDKLNPSAWDSLAEGLNAHGEMEEAIAALTRALLLEPDFAYAWKHMGEMLEECVETALVILAYEKALSSAKLYGDDFTSSITEYIKKLE